MDGVVVCGICVVCFLCGAFVARLDILANRRHDALVSREMAGSDDKVDRVADGERDLAQQLQLLLDYDGNERKDGDD